MNIIKQSSNIWGICPSDKHQSILWLEKAGRVCYRSEDKIVEGSGQVFIENIMRRKHLSVIEHSNVVIRSKQKIKYPLTECNNKKLQFCSKFLDHKVYNERVYIGGNWRAWLEWYNNGTGYHDDCDINNFPQCVMGDDYALAEGDDIPSCMQRVTVEFITDRAVTHELVRHRPATYSQESQRYVAYGDVNFIEQWWWDKLNEQEYDETLWALAQAEVSYKACRKNKRIPEQARYILPNSTATKIVVTASIPEWVFLLNLRCTKAAYAQIRHLLMPVRDQFIENGWMDV